MTTSETPKSESGDDGVAIETTQSGDDVGDITRFTTPYVPTPRSQPRSLSSSWPSSESQLEAENTVGHFDVPELPLYPHGTKAKEGVMTDTRTRLATGTVVY